MEGIELEFAGAKIVNMLTREKVDGVFKMILRSEDGEYFTIMVSRGDVDSIDARNADTLQ